MCLFWGSFLVILFRVRWASWMCGLLFFSKLESFWKTIMYLFFLLLSSSFATPITHRLIEVMMSHTFLWGFFFFILFSLWSLACIISITMSSSLLSFSYASSDLFLSPSKWFSPHYFMSNSHFEIFFHKFNIWSLSQIVSVVAFFKMYM